MEPFLPHRFQNYKNFNKTQFLYRAPVHGVRASFCHNILRIQWVLYIEIVLLWSQINIKIIYGFLYSFCFPRITWDGFLLRLRRVGFSFRSNASIFLRMFSNLRRFFNAFCLRIVAVIIASIFWSTEEKIRYGLSFFGVYGSFSSV